MSLSTTIRDIVHGIDVVLHGGRVDVDGHVGGGTRPGIDLRVTPSPKTIILYVLAAVAVFLLVKPLLMPKRGR